jgi:hypothetical protein
LEYLRDMITFMKSIGFTGSREGLANPQQQALVGLLAAFIMEQAATTPDAAPQFHHGDCVGADALSGDAAHHAGYEIHIHPPSIGTLRAYCANRYPAKVYDTFPYLVRNRNIVDSTDILLATPNGPETTRSGTWSTIRYARKKSKEIWIVHPDGKVTKENIPVPDDDSQLTLW